MTICTDFGLFAIKYPGMCSPIVESRAIASYKQCLIVYSAASSEVLGGKVTMPKCSTDLGERFFKYPDIESGVGKQDDVVPVCGWTYL